MELRASPYPLAIDGVSQFITLLESPLRKLPIVFLSPYTSNHSNLIDSSELARRLAGVAIVVEAHDADCTWDIADVLGRALSCFDGAARVYWPGFVESSDPRRHPLYLSGRIEAFGAGKIAAAIERAIFAVAAFRFTPDARITAIVSAAEEAQRQLRVESQRSASDLSWERYALDIDAELAEAKQKIVNLTAEIENLKANQHVFFATSGLDVAEPTADEQLSPESVTEAVMWAQDNCPNLIILDSALKAADKSPFQRPTDVLAALRDLDLVGNAWARERAAKGQGIDIRKALTERGWGKRCSMHIADTTKTRFAADYTFEYAGHRKLFEPHLTLGAGDANNCASIHFLPDEAANKIVVAHVGRHLRNTKT
jgi:hypothetical protein